MNELISVIIPMYNAELYIGECINSILEQTYQNIEIIIIDDGSVDNSYFLVMEKFGGLKNLRILKQENSGVSVARNYGISEATGKYLVFVDADDVCIPQYIESLYGSIVHYDLVICNMCTYSNIEEKEAEFEGGVFLPRELYADYWKYRDYNVFNCCWNKMYKKEIIDREKIFFLQGQYMGEDALFNLEYFRYCKNVQLLDIVLYKYRIHEMQTVQRGNPCYFYNIEKVYKRIAEVLKLNGVWKKNKEEYYNRLGAEIVSSIINVVKSDIPYKKQYRIIHDIVQKKIVKQAVGKKKGVINFFINRECSGILLLGFKLYYLIRK